VERSQLVAVPASVADEQTASTLNSPPLQTLERLVSPAVAPRAVANHHPPESPPLIIALQRLTI
jgi:hypothetical protein